MPTGNRAVRVPVQLRVVVRVQIDKPWGDYEARGIEHTRSAAALEAADFGNLTVLEPDVGTIPWNPRAIDNRSSPDQRIEFHHTTLLVAVSLFHTSIRLKKKEESFHDGIRCVRLGQDFSAHVQNLC